MTWEMPEWRAEYDIWDLDTLTPVAEVLRRDYLLDVSVDNSGGGCFLIFAVEPDGNVLTVSPAEGDACRWWLGLSNNDGDYIGQFVTELIGDLKSKPRPYEVAKAVAPIIELLLPNVTRIPIEPITSERIRRAIDAGQHGVGGFWAKIVEEFPEVTTGDFGPEETFALEAALDKAVRTWLMWNHPRAKEFFPELDD